MSCRIFHNQRHLNYYRMIKVEGKRNCTILTE
nr:MAG TPA: hypothetical protein [Caudoviricetes sp.]